MPVSVRAYPPTRDSEGDRLGLATSARSYLALTRPGILGLVLLTVPPALFQSGSGWPDALTIIGVLLGTTLIGGGCSALNAWYERAADARMERTRGRPLPAGELTANEALGFGVTISTLGFLVLLACGGWLAAGIGALSLIYYLVIYTAWMKPRSALSTIVGAVAGASAPLIADAAVDGAVGPWGFALFAIVFVWQPPHVWAIALFRRDDYASAGFPMLPAIVGARATRIRSLLWALALIPVTLVPWFAGPLGPAYATIALVGGLGFILAISRAIRADNDREDRRVFRFSIAYMAVLLGAMTIELLLR